MLNMVRHRPTDSLRKYFTYLFIALCDEESHNSIRQADIGASILEFKILQRHSVWAPHKTLQWISQPSESCNAWTLKGRIIWPYCKGVWKNQSYFELDMAPKFKRLLQLSRLINIYKYETYIVDSSEIWCCVHQEKSPMFRLGLLSPSSWSLQHGRREPLLTPQCKPHILHCKFHFILSVNSVNYSPCETGRC
jgi:hypothetical protein